MNAHRRILGAVLSYCRFDEKLSSVRRMGTCLLLFAACLSYSTATVYAASPSEENVQAVTRTVIGILGYTRWPSEGEVLQLCTIGSTGYAEGLERSTGVTIGGRRLNVKRVAFDHLKDSECDGIYAGEMDEQQWRKLMQLKAGQPLLTISERSALCRIGAMFCFISQAEGPGFEVNLDSIARSGLRISPKVLQLARSRAAQ